MTTVNPLSQFEQELNAYEKGSVGKLQELLKKLNEFSSTDEFANLSMGEQDKVQELIAETKEKIYSSVLINKSQDVNSQPVLSNIHDRQAEKWMEEAEGFFYSGRYADAIPLYEKALKIEPNWERAIYHCSEAMVYLEAGRIPDSALPQEVGVLYGKAQSVAHLGDYGRAKEIFIQAKQNLAEHKIIKWQEGDDFEKQLDNNIAAGTIANSAEKLIIQEKFDEAIDLTFQSYESYAKVLESLVLKYPFNNSALLRYDWINIKIRINKIRDKRKSDISARIAAFHIQAVVWFVLSVCSAVTLLAMSLYVITLAVSQDNLWLTLASFLSVIPIFASRLFYDQSLEANRRVELMQEKMNAQEQEDIDFDSRKVQQMFNKIYPKELPNHKAINNP